MCSSTTRTKHLIHKILIPNLMFDLNENKLKYNQMIIYTYVNETLKWLEYHFT